jgi:peptide/nickel transport system ATP-binding protein
MLDETNIADLKKEDLRLFRRRIQIVFQDPYSSLNPRARAGNIISEPLRLMKILPTSEHRKRVLELMHDVGLRPDQISLFPHQFSGGQRQRIVIARALGSKPDLIVCDEPVSALDVAIQAQTLNLLRKLQHKFNLTYIFISHDMGVIQYMCDVVAVMYLGVIVEQADRIGIFKHPLHPYTLALLSAVPSTRLHSKALSGRIRLKGELPSPIDPPAGCRFASRCQMVKNICREEKPSLREIGEGHFVACHAV